MWAVSSPPNSRVGATAWFVAVLASSGLPRWSDSNGDERSLARVGATVGLGLGLGLGLGPWARAELMDGGGAAGWVGHLGSGPRHPSGCRSDAGRWWGRALGRGPGGTVARTREIGELDASSGRGVTGHGQPLSHSASQPASRSAYQRASARSTLAMRCDPEARGSETKVRRHHRLQLSRRVHMIVRRPRSRCRLVATHPCGVVVTTPSRRTWVIPGATRPLSSNTKATPSTSTRSSQPFSSRRHRERRRRIAEQQRLGLVDQGGRSPGLVGDQRLVGVIGRTLGRRHERVETLGGQVDVLDGVPLPGQGVDRGSRRPPGRGHRGDRRRSGPPAPHRP